jgi:secreted trypsin-like serine protease
MKFSFAVLFVLFNSVWTLPSQLKVDIDNHIIGGQEVFPNEHKFAVALRIQGGRRSLCGGSIISPTFILTSAYCIQGSQIVEALLGAHNLAVIEIDRISINIATTNFIVHPQFNPNTRNFDIGLLRTPQINFNDRVNYVLMPDLGAQEQFTSELSLTLGWGNGSDSRLHSFQSVVMSNGFCDTFWQSGIVTPEVICGSPANNRGPCLGDEGGPMLNFDLNTRRFMLIGVMSYPDCGNGVPDLYTRVTALRQWISVQTGI